MKKRYWVIQKIDQAHDEFKRSMTAYESNDVYDQDKVVETYMIRNTGSHRLE